eukprot:TRINITY_DN1276_c0_g1_i1.p1 TRINITY_DN1276_c0_g1~~TRINITY_DN1276_c0_g1_i1.p1  ORF type:complete len:131 (-),score=28.07 TRINITY_DN1276_c0_g1_i1:280-672(-)
MNSRDTAGQERFGSVLGFAFYRRADCCVLVFDVNNGSSFENLGKWWDNLIVNAALNDPEKFPLLVIGNQIDRNCRQVPRENAQLWCASREVPYFETCAKDTKCVELSFLTLIKMAIARQLFSPALRYSET